MTLHQWLEAATDAAQRSGLPDLPGLVGTLAAATATLRAADWNVGRMRAAHPPPWPTLP